MTTACSTAAWRRPRLGIRTSTTGRQPSTSPTSCTLHQPGVRGARRILVALRPRRCPSPRQLERLAAQYLIYKTNADFLLISIGSSTIRRPRPTRARRASRPKALHRRGKTYYHFAYTYSQQVHRRNAGVSEVSRSCRWASTSTSASCPTCGAVPRSHEALLAGEVYPSSADQRGPQKEMLRIKQDELLELYSAGSPAQPRDPGEPGAGRQRDPPLTPFKFELPKR